MRRLLAQVALDRHQRCLSWGEPSRLPRAHYSAISSLPMRWAYLVKSQLLCNSNPKAHCLDKLKSQLARVVHCLDKLPIKVRGCLEPSHKLAWLQSFSELVSHLKVTLSLAKLSHRNHCSRQHRASSSLEKLLTILSILMGSSISELKIHDMCLKK